MELTQATIKQLENMNCLNAFMFVFCENGCMSKELSLEIAQCGLKLCKEMDDLGWQEYKKQKRGV